jgi:STE24 endopeptidase
MLLPFLLCLLILYFPADGTTLDAPWPLMALAVGVLAVVNAIAGLFGSSLAMRYADRGRHLGTVAAQRVFATLKGGVVGFVAADVFILRWPAVVQRILGECVWGPLVYELLLVTPALLMILTIVACQHRFERRRRTVSLGLWRYVWLRFRVEMAIVLVPWLLLVLVSSTVAIIYRGSGTEVVADGIATSGTLALILIFSPLLMRVIWQTSPLPAGPLRDRLEEFCRGQKLRCHEILVWHTYRHLANAGVVGPTPFLRYVMLSDVLLHHCSEEEVEGIFAHEAAHVRHHHLLLYLLFGLGFICLFANIVDFLAPTGLVTPVTDLLAFNMTAEQGVVMLVFAAVYLGLAFGYLSRRMEQQADLFALQSIEQPEAFVSALEKLGVLNGVPGRLSFWRHFSIPRRVEFLRAVLADPEVGVMFDFRVRLLRSALYVAIGLAAIRLFLVRPELFGL